jgi:hypothetical protein
MGIVYDSEETVEKAGGQSTGIASQQKESLHSITVQTL